MISGPMIRALLEGRKTQTRRLATSPLAKCLTGDDLWVRETCRAAELDDGFDHVEYQAGGLAPIGNSRGAGEQWGELAHYGGKGRRFIKRGDGGVAGPWVPSIHMPRWCSRLTLRIEKTRIEPLQSISEADAIAEGLWSLSKDGGRIFKWGIPDKDGLPCNDDDGQHWRDWSIDPRVAYRTLWKRLHGENSWLANPDVLVLTFSVAP
jgi:hypothetical protein